MWLASPYSRDTGGLVGADCNGDVSDLWYGENGFGLRPVVCLKSGIQLEKSVEGAEYDYEIISAKQ